MSQLEAAAGCDPILWYRVPTVRYLDVSSLVCILKHSTVTFTFIDWRSIQGGAC